MSFEGRFFKPVELPPRPEAQPPQEPAEQHTPPATETLQADETQSELTEEPAIDGEQEERYVGPLAEYEKGVRRAGELARDLAREAFLVEALLSIAEERQSAGMYDYWPKATLKQFLEDGEAREALSRLQSQLTDVKVKFYKMGLRVTEEETREKFRQLEEQDGIPRG